MDRLKKLTSYGRERFQYFEFFTKHRSLHLGNITSFLFLFTCLIITVGFYLSYPTNIKFASNNLQQNHTKTFITATNGETGQRKCDLFKGQWIPDQTGSLYTNYSCTTIQPYKNCFLQGRKDTDFLNWRWKPDQCELPPFHPEEFLNILQGKTLAFIGDSLARNQMESLLCLLSTAETPTEILKDRDAEDRVATWEFPKHDFTLKVLWAPFLVTATEQIINGTKTTNFDVQLDKIDTNWSEKLPSLDYAIISNGNWFFRQNYLYEGGDLIGCNGCGAPNVTDLGPGFGIKRAIRAAFKEINDCKDCKKIRTLLRTYSPAHFEGGAWNNGGRCNCTGPSKKEEVLNWYDLEYRNLQVGECDIARNARGGNEKTFEVIDITEMMVMRHDGHPGEFYGKKWRTGFNDCIHWCLPGPIDTWNQLLLEVINRSFI